jgi:hypothetical protein
MDTKTKTVKCRAAGSAQTWASASRKPRTRLSALLAFAGGAVGNSRWPSSRNRASTVSTSASAETAPDTMISRSGEYGSSSLPAIPAVTAKPRIIIIQTVVAAPARCCAATRLASSTSSEVPLAPTPRPTITKATTAVAMPATGWVAIQAVAMAPSSPPSPSTAMPPMIHGVLRPPTSEPWPMRGREICTA